MDKQKVKNQKKERKNVQYMTFLCISLKLRHNFLTLLSGKTPVSTFKHKACA